MADPTIPPALSPAEWAKAHGNLTVDASGVMYWGESRLSVDGDPSAIVLVDGADEVRRHALAALCLHQQSFGFTAEDVQFLRNEVCICGEDRTVGDEENREVARQYRRLYGLIARLAALVPPSDPQP